MLKYIIQNAVDDKLKLLRGKTIECISLIGLAVGKDKVCSHVIYATGNISCGAIVKKCYKLLQNLGFVNQ